MLKRIGFLSVICLLLLTPLTAAKEYRYVDMHLHYLNFVQQSQGFDALLSQMNRQGVAQSVIFGMPYSIEVTERSINNPTYYLNDDSRVYWDSLTDALVIHDYLKLSSVDQQRFLLFIGGANTNNINSARELESLLKMYPGKIKGIGELMFRHDFLTWKSGETAPTPDGATADAIFDLAARNRLPVLLHHNMTSLRSTAPIYLPEMKRALQKHPDTKLIWAHVGQSYYLHVDNLPAIVDGLLAGYRNLYFDLSWVVFEQDIAKDDDSLRQWAKLLQKYPDRFMIGTDSVGSFDNYNIRKYDRLLDLLDSETAANVAHRNILRLLPQ